MEAHIIASRAPTNPPDRPTALSPWSARRRRHGLILGPLLILIAMFALAPSSDAATRGPAPYGCLDRTSKAVRELKSGQTDCKSSEVRVRLYNCINKTTHGRGYLDT